jgi:yecA family protein
MNLEKLDGFFAALICSPDIVRPSEYLPEIWGGEMADEEAFTNQQELRDFLDLVMRHWNAISDVLHSGDVFLPLLLEDEQGHVHANDWRKDSCEAWRCGMMTGESFSTMRSMAAPLSRFSRWRMNTTRIQG